MGIYVQQTRAENNLGHDRANAGGKYTEIAGNIPIDRKAFRQR